MARKMTERDGKLIVIEDGVERAPTEGDLTAFKDKYPRKFEQYRPLIMRTLGPEGAKTFFDVAGGSVKEEQVVTALQRFLVNTLTTNPKSAFALLKARGWEGSGRIRGGRLELKKKGSDTWGVVDPKGFEWIADTSDLVDESVKTVGTTAAGLAGLAVGSPTGPGALLASGTFAAGAATILESLRQVGGELAGAKGNINKTSIVVEGALNALPEAGLLGMAGTRAVARGISNRMANPVTRQGAQSIIARYAGIPDRGPRMGREALMLSLEKGTYKGGNIEDLNVVAQELGERLGSKALEGGQAALIAKNANVPVGLSSAYDDMVKTAMSPARVRDRAPGIKVAENWLDDAIDMGTREELERAKAEFLSMMTPEIREALGDVPAAQVVKKYYPARKRFLDGLDTSRGDKLKNTLVEDADFTPSGKQLTPFQIQRGQAKAKVAKAGYASLRTNLESVLGGPRGDYARLNAIASHKNKIMGETRRGLVGDEPVGRESMLAKTGGERGTEGRNLLETLDLELGTDYAKRADESMLAELIGPGGVPSEETFLAAHGGLRGMSTGSQIAGATARMLPGGVTMRLARTLGSAIGLKALRSPAAVIRTTAGILPYESAIRNKLASYGAGHGIMGSPTNPILSRLANVLDIHNPTFAGLLRSIATSGGSTYQRGIAPSDVGEDELLNFLRQNQGALTGQP